MSVLFAGKHEGREIRVYKNDSGKIVCTETREIPVPPQILGSVVRALVQEACVAQAPSRRTLSFPPSRGELIVKSRRGPITRFIGRILEGS